MKIQINNLTKIYHEKSQLQVLAFHNISFSVTHGEIIGIIGPSGCGKSSLFRCLAGVIKPSSGKIDKVFDTQETVGLMIQEPEAQFFLESVYDEISFALKNKGLPEDEINERVHSVLNQVDFHGELIQSPFRLSGGEKKKVALASIIITEPSLLLLDEPTVGLDDSGLQMLYNLIQEYRRFSRTIIIVSHDLDFLYQSVDRFLLLEAGSLVADFPTMEFFRYADQLKDMGVGIPEKVALRQRNPPHFVKDFL